MIEGYGKKCSLRSEILGVRSWCSVHGLACERVSQHLIKLFLLTKMCTGSDLPTFCNLGHKLMYRIIRDTLHCPDPAKMGAASPRELFMYGLPKGAFSLPSLWSGICSHTALLGCGQQPGLSVHSAAVGSSSLCFCAWSFAPVTFEVGLFQCKLLRNVMTDPRKKKSCFWHRIQVGTDLIKVSWFSNRNSSANTFWHYMVSFILSLIYECSFPTQDPCHLLLNLHPAIKINYCGLSAVACK